MSDYQPIPCATHERLEFAVLRRIRIRLIWREAATNREIREIVHPMDVQTRDGAEWLRVQREKGTLEWLRLDCILSFTEM